VAAFPEQIGLFIQSRCPEVLLAVLDHQNVDICLEAVTLLVELTDEDMASQQPDAIVKLQQTLIENSVWTVLLKIITMSLNEIKNS